MNDRSDRDVWYFAYGSNLWQKQKEGRTGPIHKAIVAHLPGYRLAFNKRSTRHLNRVYANIVPDPDAEVWGVIYECSPEAMCKMDRCEGSGYAREPIGVLIESGEAVEAVTYVATTKSVCQEDDPGEEYLTRIVAGAREHGLPERYIMQELKSRQRTDH